MAGEKQTTLADLQPDPKNARKHNPRNVGMIEKSLREVGAGRSIVLDENNVVLAGNATIEAAAAAGIEKVKIVETDGNTIIAVRRSGLTDAQKAKLALYDNRTAELAEWDEEVLRQLCEDMPDVSAGMWSDAELRKLMDAAEEHFQLADAPDSVEENARELETIKQRRSGNDNIENGRDTERYLVVVFATRADRESKLTELGLPTDERYVAASMVDVTRRVGVSFKPVGPKASPAKKSGATG